MNEEGLGHRLQSARQNAGLTQQGLCQKANLSYSTLAKIERGAIKSPSIFIIQQIAEALNMSLDDLIGHRSSAEHARKQHRTKSGVRFVYFDVNGCLIRSYQRAFSRLAHDSGQPADVVETFFWHYNDRVCRGELSMDEFNAKLAEKTHMASVNWADYYLNSVEPMPSMPELVRWVSDLYGVGLFTNVMPGFLHSLLEKGILPNIDYDVMVDSSVEHSIKPEAKIYQIAIEKAKVAPQEILLIDDTRANLMAAEKLGLHVMWFDDTRPEESAKHIKQSLEPAKGDSETVRPQVDLPEADQAYYSPSALEPVPPEALAPLPTSDYSQSQQAEPYYQQPVVPAASPSDPSRSADTPVQW